MKVSLFFYCDKHELCIFLNHLKTAGSVKNVDVMYTRLNKME